MSEAGVPMAGEGRPPRGRWSTGSILLIVALAVGFLLAIPIAAVVAAIAIPNLIDATQRAKQQRTLAEMRAIGQAIEIYATDREHYPIAANLRELSAALTPEILQEVPRRDGWNNEFRAESGPAGYTITSAGRGGQFERGLKGGATDRFEDDIWYANGGLVQWPAGRQRSR